MKTPPYLTIQQCINTYKYLFKPKPSFGMDFFDSTFEAKDIVLLEDEKENGRGIPIRFNYYALFLRLKGETKRTINQFNYHVKAHSLQLVNPGTIYSFQDMTDISKTYVLLFNKTFIEENSLDINVQKDLLDFHYKYQQDMILGTTQFAYAVSIYEQLSNELKTKRNDYKIICKLLINQLLFLLKREKTNAGITQNLTRAEQISSEFLILIEEHFWQKRSVKSYASILNITPKYLSETINSTLNHTALSCIHIRIVKEIQYLLSFSDMSIKQIAYALNFGTLSEFGRFFKRYEKISPKEYRLKNRSLIKKMNS